VEGGDAPRETEGAQPETRTERTNSYSGRLLLRMPESLHQALARASEAEHVSLNAFINDALQKTVNPRAASKPDSRSPSGSRSPRSPTINRLLVVNLIVVAIVGILAIVLVVQALR
jgi:hypothetical protein